MANGTLNSRSFQIRAGTMMNSLTPSNNPSFSSEGKFLPLDDLLAALYRHCEVFLPTTRQHGAARAEQLQLCGSTGARGLRRTVHHVARSEEHTSELQSLRHLVCRLLLEKK